MARKPLRSQLNQIRAWVRQGRTDAWIAHQLDIPASELREFRRRHELAPEDEEAGDLELRDEIEAEIERDPDDEEADDEEEDEEPRGREADEEAETSRGRRRRRGRGQADAGRRRRRRRRRGAAAAAARRAGKAAMQATFDHGADDGFGLWLDPAVEDDPVYSEHWAGHRPRRGDDRAGPDRDQARLSAPTAASGLLAAWRAPPAASAVPLAVLVALAVAARPPPPAAGAAHRPGLRRDLDQIVAQALEHAELAGVRPGGEKLSHLPQAHRDRLVGEQVQGDVAVQLAALVDLDAARPAGAAKQAHEPRALGVAQLSDLRGRIVRRLVAVGVRPRGLSVRCQARRRRRARRGAPATPAAGGRRPRSAAPCAPAPSARTGPPSDRT